MLNNFYHAPIAILILVEQLSFLRMADFEAVIFAIRTF